MHQHFFTPSEKEGYEKCTECGTYHSTQLLTPNEIYNNYWGDGTGRSTLDQQCDNLTCIDDCGISKVDRVLQFVPKRGKTFLEIGCAPGVLLDKMLDRNFECYGIEPSVNYISFIIEKARGAMIMQGYFPDVTMKFPNGFFDCIVAMDVWEHYENYDIFIREVRRLLKDKGRAIIMSPIIYEDGLIRQTEFKPDEHAWIFTKTYLEPYLKEIFSEVKFTRWITSHEMIILDK